MNSFISTGSFLVESLGFSMYGITWSANIDSFILPFQFECLSFLLLVWLLWLGLPVLCWIRKVKADIPVFFPIIRGSLVVFAHQVQCWQWVCHIWPLLCLVIFLLFPLFWEVFFYHKQVLDFIKCFFCIYWYDRVVFTLHFVYVVYYIYSFADIVPTLHPCLRINPTRS